MISLGLYQAAPPALTPEEEEAARQAAAAAQQPQGGIGAVQTTDPNAAPPPEYVAAPVEQYGAAGGSDQSSAGVAPVQYTTDENGNVIDQSAPTYDVAPAPVPSTPGAVSSTSPKDGAIGMARFGYPSVPPHGDPNTSSGSAMYGGEAAQTGLGNSTEIVTSHPASGDPTGYRTVDPGMDQTLLAQTTKDAALTRGGDQAPYQGIPNYSIPAEAAKYRAAHPGPGSASMYYGGLNSTPGDIAGDPDSYRTKGGNPSILKARREYRDSLGQDIPIGSRGASMDNYDESIVHYDPTNGGASAYYGGLNSAPGPSLGDRVGGFLNTVGNVVAPDGPPRGLSPSLTGDGNPQGLTFQDFTPESIYSGLHTGLEAEKATGRLGLGDVGMIGTGPGGLGGAALAKDAAAQDAKTTFTVRRTGPRAEPVSEKPPLTRADTRPSGRPGEGDFNRQGGVRGGDYTVSEPEILGPAVPKGYRPSAPSVTMGLPIPKAAVPGLTLLGGAGLAGAALPDLPTQVGESWGRLNSAIDEDTRRQNQQRANAAVPVGAGLEPGRDLVANRHSFNESSMYAPQNAGAASQYRPAPVPTPATPVSQPNTGATSAPPQGASVLPGNPIDTVARTVQDLANESPQVAQSWIPDRFKDMNTHLVTAESVGKAVGQAPSTSQTTAPAFSSQGLLDAKAQLQAQAAGGRPAGSQVATDKGSGAKVITKTRPDGNIDIVGYVDEGGKDVMFGPNDTEETMRAALAAHGTKATATTPAQGGASPTQPAQSTTSATPSASPKSTAPTATATNQAISDDSTGSSSYDYTPRQSTSRSSSATQARGSISDMFSNDDEDGLNIDDFMKDYDGDGKVSTKDRSIGKKRYIAAKSKRRGKKGKTTGFSNVPQRAPSPIRTKTLDAINTSVSKKR